MTLSTRFLNKAGDHADTDSILRAELRAAGIQTLQEAEGQDDDYLADMLRRRSGEVKTSVIGVLHGWTFKRNWYYWVASGPGIEVGVAEALHAAHGKDVRVDGDAGCQSPRKAFKGLACGGYHVDTQEGLNALAATIKGLVERPETTRNISVEKKTGYALTGSTGCTCCASENFGAGTWDTLEEAWDNVKHHRERKTVSSQYSKTGEYSVYKIDYELLGDGRVLLFDRVLQDFRFWENDLYDTIRWAGQKMEEVNA